MQHTEQLSIVNLLDLFKLGDAHTRVELTSSVNKAL